jgi:hypothetical protein
MGTAIPRGRRAVPVAALLLLSAAGCSHRLSPVGGRVTYEDGTPVTYGMVIFESKEGPHKITARGLIQPDGSYQLSMAKPGDGVPPGPYRVLIGPGQVIDPDAPPPLPFDKHYTDFATSGLEYEVQAGPNEFVIKLERPHKGHC